MQSCTAEKSHKPVLQPYHGFQSTLNSQMYPACTAMHGAETGQQALRDFEGPLLFAVFGCSLEAFDSSHKAVDPELATPSISETPISGMALVLFAVVARSATVRRFLAHAASHFAQSSHLCI